MSVSAIVLAAGEGTRMRSARPKPLHLICGRAMVLHVIDALERLHPARTAVVVGHGAEQVTKKVHDLAPLWANVVFVEQHDQRGTGDAAAIGMTAFPGDDLDDDSTVVVLPGDTPLLQPETLDLLVATHVANGSAATLLTSVVEDPTGYGRVIRAPDGRVLRIVEQRDASPEELDVHEVCTSEALDAKVDEIVAAIVANGPMAARACKQLVQDVAGRPIDAELRADTARRIADIRASAEGREGASSFLNKRKPAWLQG